MCHNRPAYASLRHKKGYKVAIIREVTETIGARLLYLSPYSPDFNPIEDYWSKVKQFLRSSATRTYVELDQAIMDALAGVNSTGHRWLVYSFLLV